MLIEHGWTPGVWIDGDPSHDTARTGVFGTFAHHVHEDLLTARSDGRIPARVEITVSASTIRPLWGDAFDLWLLHIRFAGLSNPDESAARAEVTATALAILDRRGSDELLPDGPDRYGGSLFFVDDRGFPRDRRTHKLDPPSGT